MRPFLLYVDELLTGLQGCGHTRAASQLPPYHCDAEADKHNAAHRGHDQQQVGHSAGSGPERRGEGVLQGQHTNMHPLRCSKHRLDVTSVGVAGRYLLVQPPPDIGQLRDQRITIVPDLHGRRENRAGAEQPEQADHAGNIGGIVVPGQESAGDESEVRMATLQLQACDPVTERNRQLRLKSLVVRFIRRCSIAAQVGDGLSFGL